MIVDLFTWLSGALTQSPEIAIGAAFIWGVLSVILSPCHIACIPLIVGFIDGQGRSAQDGHSVSLFFSVWAFSSRLALSDSLRDWREE